LNPNACFSSDHTLSSNISIVPIFSLPGSANQL
jgi:hypothetical protein